MPSFDDDAAHYIAKELHMHLRTSELQYSRTWLDQPWHLLSATEQAALESVARDVQMDLVTLGFGPAGARV